MDTEGMNAAEIIKLAESLTAKAIEVRKEEQRKARLEARARAAAEQEEHFSRMFIEIGQPLAGLNEKQHAHVYSMAWEHGHDSGFSGVENYYGDFAELARQIIASN